MASVDMTELIPSLESLLTVPGATSPYAAASEVEWTNKIVNAFWRGVIEGVIENYTIDEDGVVSPSSGSTTFPQSLQYVVVIYAAMNVIEAQLLQLKTVFRAKAGPLEYETQQASQVLTGLLKSLDNQKNIILERLSDLGGGTDTYYYDAPWERRYRQTTNDTHWMGY